MYTEQKNKTKQEMLHLARTSNWSHFSEIIVLVFVPPAFFLSLPQLNENL